MRHVLRGLLVGGLVVGAIPVRAQPIIIPLQQQSNQPQDRPEVSAPPVAPPQAGPSLPSTNDVAGGSRISPPDETASQPASK